MYYKSQINAAYNLIYIGQFQAARLQLRSVRKAVTQQMLSEREKEQVESSSSSCRQDISNGKDQPNFQIAFCILDIPNDVSQLLIANCLLQIGYSQ